MITARFIRFSSSRTLPGQGHCVDRGQRARREALDLRVHLAEKRGQEMLGEQDGIAVALGEARDLHDDLGEAVIEILAEAARRDHLVQVLVGGADDARVDRDRLAAADPLDHPLLEEAQQLDLERQRDVADLVEEQGAAMGELDLALGRS